MTEPQIEFLVWSLVVVGLLYGAVWLLRKMRALGNK